MKKLIIIMGIITAGINAKAQSWLTVGTGVSGGYFDIVQALGVYNGDLIAGGSFDTAGGMPANYIASWNGTVWSKLGSGINGNIDAVIEYKGNLIAGGSFDTAGGSPANNIAVWNGTAWAPLGMGTNANVNALTIYQGNLIVAGWFTTAGGSPANYIASWNGTAWAAIGTGLNGNGYALDTASNGSTLYVGGYFSTAGGNPAANIASWDGATWSALGTGVNNSVQALTLYSGNLIAGGGFTLAGGNPVSYVASWSGSAWAALGSGVPAYVNALTAWNGNLCAAENNASSQVDTWNGTAWTPLPKTLDSLYALGVYQGNLYAGGGFRYIGNNVFNNIAEWCDSCAPLGINQVSVSASNVVVFPNPSNGKFTVELQNVQATNNMIEVYNMLGEKIYTANLNSTKTQIDLSSKVGGVYLYRIMTETGNQVSLGKLIIQ